MPEDTRGWLVQPNPSKTYTNDAGEETFGALEWAYRRPGDHVWIYSGTSADQEPPQQSVQEHYEASGHEAPLPDSVIAANEVAQQQTQQEGQAQAQAQQQAQAQAQQSAE